MMNDFILVEAVFLVDISFPCVTTLSSNFAVFLYLLVPLS